MSKLEVKEQATSHASAEKVYSIIADYRKHHPQILPQPYFASLDIESGGIGEGTIFRTTLAVMGRKFEYRMRVSEQKHLGVITESDFNSDLVTTFTVKPQGEHEALVTIASSWTPKKGFQGILERLFTPGLTRKIYRTELKKLDEYAQSI